MKKKPLFLLTLLLLSLLLPVGCQSGKKEGGPLAITDELTHRDPEDIDYIERVVMTAGQDSEYIQGLGFFLEEVPEKALVLIYGDADNALRVYEYSVFRTEEGARALYNLMTGDGFLMEQQGRVTLLVSEADELLDELTALNVRERIWGYLASDLAELYIQEYGFLLNEGGEMK